MDLTQLAQLPVGSVVSHKNSAATCTYRKMVPTTDGVTGWAVARVGAPWDVLHSDVEWANVDLGCGKDVTLIFNAGPSAKSDKGPSKKDLRIAELEAEVAAGQAALSRAQDEIIRLHSVIRAARGTLGAN